MEPLETFSRVMFVDECLLDEKRTKAFEAAIRNKVNKGDIVMDAGTGSGIMALFAARTGAQKVYAVEVDPEVVLLAKNSFRSNREGENISLIQSDLTKLEFDKPVDVLIMELLDTGLINELQAQAINSLRDKGVINDKTKLIPERADCAVQLIEYDFSFYGFTMPMIVQARNHGTLSHIKNKLSRTVVYKEIDFNKKVDTKVAAELVVPIQKEGLLNSVLLRTKIILDKNIYLWETTDMNMPVIMPITPLNVAKGDNVLVKISYEMGRGFDGLVIEAQVSK